MLPEDYTTQEGARDAQDATHAAHLLLGHGVNGPGTIRCPDTGGATAFNLLAPYPCTPA